MQISSLRLNRFVVPYSRLYLTIKVKFFSSSSSSISYEFYFTLYLVYTGQDCTTYWSCAKKAIYLITLDRVKSIVLDVYLLKKKGEGFLANKDTTIKIINQPRQRYIFGIKNDRISGLKKGSI